MSYPSVQAPEYGFQQSFRMDAKHQNVEEFDWDQFIQDNIWGPVDSNVNKTEPDLFQFDQWLSQQSALGDSAVIDRKSTEDQSRIVSPPLHAGFFSSATPCNEPLQSPPQDEVTDENLKSSVEILQMK